MKKYDWLIGLLIAGLISVWAYHHLKAKTPEEEFDFKEHFKQKQREWLLITLEQAKQDAIKTCNELGGNITAAKVFAQLKSELQVADPNYTFYKVRNITKTFYKVCVVDNRAYIPICRFEGCNPNECGIEEYHCFAPQRLAEAPFYFTYQPYAWTMEYNVSLTDSGIEYPKRFIAVDPTSPRFYELRYVGEVYNGATFG